MGKILNERRKLTISDRFDKYFWKMRLVRQYSIKLSMFL